MKTTTVKRTTNWGTAANNTTIPFDTAEIDDDTLWTVSDPTKIGPLPAAYEGLRGVLYAGAIWAGSSNGYRELKAFRNGDANNPVVVQQVQANASNTGLTMTSRPLVLHEGDYFELVGRSAISTSILAATDYSTTFTLETRD